MFKNRKESENRRIPPGLALPKDQIDRLMDTVYGESARKMIDGITNPAQLIEEGTAILKEALIEIMHPDEADKMLEEKGVME